MGNKPLIQLIFRVSKGSLMSMSFHEKRRFFVYHQFHGTYAALPLQ